MKQVEHWHDIYQSWRRLPRWVQIWVAGFLVPVHATSFLLLSTVSGLTTAVAATLVVASNGWLLWHERGFGKLMSLPHLIVWFPLVYFLLQRIDVIGSDSSSIVEFYYAVITIALTSISLLFDVMDAVRWWRGERAIS